MSFREQPFDSTLCMICLGDVDRNVVLQVPERKHPEPVKSWTIWSETGRNDQEFEGKVWSRSLWKMHWSNMIQLFIYYIYMYIIYMYIIYMIIYSIYTYICMYYRYLAISMLILNPMNSWWFYGWTMLNIHFQSPMPWGKRICSVIVSSRQRSWAMRDPLAQPIAMNWSSTNGWPVSRRRTRFNEFAILIYAGKEPIESLYNMFKYIYNHMYIYIYDIVYNYLSLVLLITMNM